jgi:hypothetical protein
MARHLAATHLGLRVSEERVEGDVVPYLLEELTAAPELWAQKSYLARTVSADGASDIVPLAHFLDAPGPDAVAVAVEMDAEGKTYPAVYLRRDGEIAERILPPHLLNDFRGPEHEGELRALL